jgi:hypothetical protein
MRIPSDFRMAHKLRAAYVISISIGNISLVLDWHRLSSHRRPDREILRRNIGIEKLIHSNQQVFNKDQKIFSWMMRKHPELQPYTPSDRYGIVTNRVGLADDRRPKFAAAQRSGREPLSQHKSNQVKISRGPLLARPGKEEVEGEPQSSGENAAKSATRPTRQTAKTSPLNRQSNDRVPMANSSKLDSLHNRKDRANQGRRAKTMEKTKPQTRMVEMRPDAGIQISPPDDSGVEAESMSIDVSSASSSTNDSDPSFRVEPRRDSPAESQKPLSKASEHLEAMARKEDEDRQSRMLIVENILSRLKLTQRD